jgi:hypothetical protein
MISSGERLVNAHQRVQMAVSPEEKKRALAELVAAEILHYDKLGIPREPRGFLQRIVLPVGLILVVVVTMVLVVAFSKEASDTAGDVAVIQRQSVIDNRETCVRQNEARSEAVREKEADLATLKTQLNLWALVAKNANPKTDPNTPPEIATAFQKFLDRLGDGVKAKEQAIQGLIAPYAEVAIKPGSPVVDCKLVYPLR